MSIENKSNKVRVVESGYGITGVRLNFSLLHMYHLAELREEMQKQLEAMKTKSVQNENQYLLEETLKILNFIVGDFTHPRDPKLWMSSEE